MHQLSGTLERTWLEKRRNVRITFCEFFSHFIIFLLLQYGYRLSKMFYFDAGVYSTFEFPVPPIPPFQNPLTLLYSTLDGPIRAPPFDAYIIAGRYIQDQIATQGRSSTFWLLRTTQGRTYANLLLKGALHFAPNGPEVHSLINYLNSTTVYFKTLKVFVHNDKRAALKYILANTGDRTWALIALNEVNPSSVNYVIRLNYTTLPNTNLIVNPLTRGLGRLYQRYIISGYSTLQLAVDEWAFNYTGASRANEAAYQDCHVPTPFFTPYPTPPYDANPFFAQVGFLLGLAMTMSTLYPMSRLAKGIVEEKESRMREIMKIMGLKDWVHQLSWFISSFILFFWIALSSSYLSSSSFLPKSDKVLLFIYFFLFNMSEITLSFLISVFFSNSKLASIVAPVRT